MVAPLAAAAGGLQALNSGAQFLQTLVGTSGSTTASGSGATNSNRTIDLEQLATVLSNINSRTQRDQTSVEQGQSLDNESLTALQDEIKTLLAQANDDDNFANLRESIVANIVDSGIGNVLKQGSNAGAYDSTVVGRTGERLASRAANEGAAAEVSAQDALVARIAQLFNVEKGARTQNTTDITGKESTSQTEKSTTEQTSKTKDKTQTKTKQKSKGTTQQDGLLDSLGGLVGGGGLLGGIGGLF